MPLASIVRAAGPLTLPTSTILPSPTATDPDEAGVTDEAIVNAASDWAARIFRLESPEPAAVETCLYTNTADARFVLERHDRIVVCSACSGHGFKFAPAVGVRTAELVSEVARPS